MKLYKIIAAFIVIPLQILFGAFVLFIIVSAAPIFAGLTLSFCLLICVSGLIPAFNKRDDAEVYEMLINMGWCALITVCLALISYVAYLFGYDPTGMVTSLFKS